MRRLTHRTALVAIGCVSAVTSAIVLVAINSALHDRHLPGDPSGGMGQGFPATGLEGGPRVAQETLRSWSDHAAVHGGPTGRSLARWWLVIDVLFLALAGYGLLAAVIHRWARDSRAGADRRENQLLRFVVAGSMLGLILVVVDIIENTMAALVIATDGNGPAAVLRIWGRAKWMLAAAALITGVPALVAIGWRRLRR
jgi:hypothetical protein